MKAVVALAMVVALLLGLSAACVWAAPCAQCNAELPDGAKFCPECGAKAQPANCPKCQAKLPAGAKFCPECGQKVDTSAAPTPEVRAAPGPRPKQRYEGIFPVALYGSGYGPLGEKDLESEAAREWQKRFLETLKDLGFNTIAGSVPKGMISLAEQAGMYVITGGHDPKPLGKPDLTPEEARTALADVDAVCREHKNVIASILYADPVKPEWLPAWRVYGGVWNQMHPDVPLLATYADAAQWKQFDGAAPIGAAQGWVYKWRESTTWEQALTPPVCIGPDCRGGRTAMPGLPIWPWIQCFGNGWGFRWPTTAEYRAAHHLILVEGVRGALCFMWGQPRAGSPEFLANERNEPAQQLLDLKPIVREFGAIGTELLGYEIDDSRPVSAGMGAAASLYVHRTDPRKVYIMIASRDVEDPQEAPISFDSRGEQGITGLQDFMDHSVIPARYEGENVVAKVELQPAAGRLLSLVMR